MGWSPSPPPSSHGQYEEMQKRAREMGAGNAGERMVEALL
ncbi:hypothetical protein HKBW3S42_01640, partial [Candidatus Hakubella thermalkaliphila]